MKARTTTSSLRGHRRWWLWIPLLAASAWLALQEAPPEAVPIAGDNSVRPMVRKGDAQPEVANDALTPLVSRDQWFTPHSNDVEPVAMDLFGLRSWTPPPPPPSTTQAPPPPPMAPPLPFTFLGKKSEMGSWEVYLGRGENTYIVREGTRFAENYRVERIAPPQMTLTYLPLEQSQSMSVGDLQ